MMTFLSFMSLLTMIGSGMFWIGMTPLADPGTVSKLRILAPSGR